MPEQSHESPRQGLGPTITPAGQRNGPHRATSDTWASLSAAPSSIPGQAEFSKLKLASNPLHFGHLVQEQKENQVPVLKLL